MYPNNPEAEVNKLEYFRADGSADLKVLEEGLRDAGLTEERCGCCRINIQESD
jgi:hypothetical protein